MGSKKYRFSLSEHKLYHRDKLLRFLRNRYSYQFTSNDDRLKYEKFIPFRYLEKLVSIYGRGAIYRHKDYGFAVYKPVLAGNIDIYGNPGTYFLYTANGLQLHKVQADDPNLIILGDHFDGTSLQRVADYYADQMGKTRETIMTNVAAMRMPYLVTAPKEKVMAVKMALEAINEAPEVIDDPNIAAVESIKVFDLKVPDFLKSLEDELNTIFGKFKEEIGFSNQSIDKKERLVAAEAENDDDTLKAFDNEPYENRKKFIKAMDDKFNIKLTLIKANQELYNEDKKTMEEDLSK